jgi:hypothetical protein
MTRIKIHFGAMVALVAAAQAWIGPCRGGEEPPGADQANDVVPFADSQISRYDWKLRIEDARKRAAQARQDSRLNAPLRVPAPDPPEKIATERVLNDDTLQPGDIVSTDKGFFLFRGRSGTDEQTMDFVPVMPR